MEKIWLKNYEEGVRPEIDLNQFSSLIDYFEHYFRKYSDRVAYINLGKSMTFKQIDNASKAFANYLTHELKLKKGDRVAIMLPNVMQFPIAMYGIHRAGMIAVNVNPLYTARELAHVLKDSEAAALVALANFGQTVQKANELVPVKHLILTQLGDMLGVLKGTLVNFVVKRVKKMVPAYKLPQAKSFKNCLSKGKKHHYSKIRITQDDIAYLQYTGGTTGVAKGAILTHRNMLANVTQATEWLKPLLKRHEFKGGIITALPLYHIFSLTANCLTFLAVGIPNILITNPRDIPGFIKELKSHDFAVITGVNTLFNALLNNEDFKTVDFSKLHLTLGGGMAVQKAVAERWQKVTGTPLLEAYGLTEASPAVTINPTNLKQYNGSIGLPIPSTDISIRNDKNEEVPLGEVGELCVKGPQVMRGYWKDEENTQKAFTEDGWLKTGDMVSVDEQGFVRVVDRKKDMISVSGFKVYPNEVEDIIAMLDDVLEVAVVGKPDPDHGERVCAYVVKKSKALTQEKILEHCKENLTKYKIPKEVVFKDELPKTNVGKVLRRELRDEAK